MKDKKIKEWMDRVLQKGKAAGIDSNLLETVLAEVYEEQQEEERMKIEARYVDASDQVQMLYGPPIILQKEDSRDDEPECLYGPPSIFGNFNMDEDEVSEE